MKKPKPPTIEFEDIGPELAAKYLEKNITNRVIRKSTLLSYARDMRLGKWIPTHQGIAFNDRGELIDGQHRLHAIVEAAIVVKILVTRGIPSEQGSVRTMDAVDRGAVRSVADQLQLQHGYRNAAQVAGCGSVIIDLIIRDRIGRLSVPQMLAVLEIYGRHIEAVTGVINRGATVMRRSPVCGALAFARAAEPSRIDDFTQRLESGAGLDVGSPILLLRNSLFSQRIMAPTSARRFKARFVLNCAQRFVTGELMQRQSYNRAGFIFFAGRQKKNIAKIGELFSASTSSLTDIDEVAVADSSPAPVAPPRVITAENFKLTPAAAALLQGKEMSDRLHGVGGRAVKMRDRIAKGEIAGPRK